MTISCLQACEWNNDSSLKPLGGGLKPVSGTSNSTFACLLGNRLKALGSLSVQNHQQALAVFCFTQNADPISP